MYAKVGTALWGRVGKRLRTQRSAGSSDTMISRRVSIDDLGCLASPVRVTTGESRKRPFLGLVGGLYGLLRLANAGERRRRPLGDFCKGGSDEVLTFDFLGDVMLIG